MLLTKKHLYIFIAIVAFVKIFFAACLELGNDESYYYTYALQPQLNYFDHPPLVGLLIKLTTLNLNAVNNITLRLGAILSCSVASIIIYKIVENLYNTKAASVAVMLYNFNVYTGVIAGFFIMPDSLQMPLWCAAIYFITQIVYNNKEKKFTTWLCLGIVIGVAMLCKVHSLYVWAGFGLYIIFNKTKWLFNYRLYVAFIVTLLFCLPILIWNIDNNFITYSFHSQRVSHTNINVDGLLQEVVREALYQNPIIFIALVVGIIMYIKNRKTIQIPYTNLLLWLSVPMIFLFWTLAMFNDIFPHWSGPGYIALTIWLSIVIAKINVSFLNNAYKIAGTLLIVIFIIVAYVTNFYGNNFGKKEALQLGDGCPTLDISGWQKMSKEFNEWYKKDITTNKTKSPVMLINNWFPACQLELYTSRLTHIPILAIGNLQDVHQFAWLNKTRPKLVVGNDAYCIIPSNQYFNINEVYGKYFEKIEQATTINQVRGNNVVRYFYVYKLKNCISTPTPIL